MVIRPEDVIHRTVVHINRNAHPGILNKPRKLLSCAVFSSIKDKHRMLIHCLCLVAVLINHALIKSFH